MTADSRNDVLTVAAIAVLAFLLTDIAHEVVGHGAAYFAAGGRGCVLTTTRLIGTVHSELGDRLFALGGPLGNFACAGLAWLILQRSAARPSSPHRRVFLWLTMAFSLLWGIGYFFYSGFLAAGDWAILVRGLAPASVWQPALVLLGFVLYPASVRFIAATMPRIVTHAEPDRRQRLRRLVTISYLTAGLVACAAAALDPRGSQEVLFSAVPETFLGNIGMFAVPGLLTWRVTPGTPRQSTRPDSRDGDIPPQFITRSAAWLATAAVAAAAFIGLLGPGIPLSW